jgi:hypothetical protein
MNDSDKKEFAKIFVAMGENFNATVTKEGLKIRFEALKEFSIDQVRQACIELVKNRVYPGMPVSGEIRAAIVGGSGGDNSQKIEDIAQQRVNEIMGQIRTVGSYGSPTWSDPVVSDLLSRRWNWQSLCAMTETELKWWAKEFIEAYKSHQSQPMIENKEAKTMLSELARRIGN